MASHHRGAKTAFVVVTPIAGSTAVQTVQNEHRRDIRSLCQIAGVLSLGGAGTKPAGSP